MLKKILPFVVAAVIVSGLAVRAATAPVLKTDNVTFTLTFEPGYGFACVEFESLAQKGYKPSKCQNFGPEITTFRTDWVMVNCTLDDIGRESPTCPDNREWNVRGYVQLAGSNKTKVYSNVVRVTYRSSAEGAI